MKKILLLDSSYPLNSRNTRLLKTLEKNYEVSFITWNRDESVIEDNEFENRIFNKKSLYGNKKSKLLNLLSYYKFIKKEIRAKKPDILITSHWDMFFIGSLLKTKKNYKIIYENLDIPESKNRIVEIFLKKVEKFFLKNADGMIVASRFFVEKYSFKNTLIYENYPYKYNLLENKKEVFSGGKRTIAYIGTVRYFEVFKNFILAFANDSNINMMIYGGGPDEEKAKKFCEKNSILNIKFNGPYNYKNVNSFYNQTDLVWAAYPSDSENVKFAISNKFFETLSYKTVGIFSEKTALGDLVKKENIGLVVNPYDPVSIRSVVSNVMIKDLENIKENITEYTQWGNIFWEDNENRLLYYIKEIEKI
ncbi:glycosyltransferase [Planococcus sp. YIM B11945]|uniref:glycosyltransferase n=1 Tax=Planococcus sp. YIM B11945 TaxID=3435410 RepID=UPI003D7E7A5C